MISKLEPQLSAWLFKQMKQRTTISNSITTTKEGPPNSGKPDVSAKGVERAIMVSESDLVSLANEVNTVFGSGSGIILFHQGFGIGLNIAAELQKRTQEKKAAFREFEGTMQRRGWGRIVIEGSEESFMSGKIVFSDLPFTSEEPFHEILEMLLRGICSGFIAKTLNTDNVPLHKEKCVSSGQDVCMFSFEIEEAE